MEAKVHKSEKIAIEKEEDIALARSKVRDYTSEEKLGIVSSTKLITAASEIVRNMIEYAGGGVLILEIVQDGTRRGIRVICKDRGPGIEDIDTVMIDGYSSKGSLGLGVPGSKRLVNEFYIESEPGNGTEITMVQWAA